MELYSQRTRRRLLKQARQGNFLIKLIGEEYYLCEGPSGYAYSRSKARAVPFTTREAAELMLPRLSCVEIVQVTKR